jgi:hypothetical protein
VRGEVGCGADVVGGGLGVAVKVSHSGSSLFLPKGGTPHCPALN